LKIEHLLFPINDWRFCEQFFNLIPLTYLLKVAKVRESKYQQYLNATNFASAYGWTGLNAAFGGDKDFTRLLPFKVDNEESTVGLNTPTDATLKILKTLFAKNQIPRPVLMELGALGILKKISD
jgi:hypothetical protein